MARNGSLGSELDRKVAKVFKMVSDQKYQISRDKANPDLATKYDMVYLCVLRRYLQCQSKAVRVKIVI